VSRRAQRPVRLLGVADDERFLSKETCDAVVRRIRGFAQGGGETMVRIDSWWHGELRWARNRVDLASDRRDVSVRVTRGLPDGGRADVSTNQLDDRSLQAAVYAAERQAKHGGGMTIRDITAPAPVFDYQQPSIWSDTTYRFATDARAQIARRITDKVEAARMLAAGYMEVKAQSTARTAAAGMMYAERTAAQCSMTVRDAAGTGSGWAGLSSYNWGAIDADALSARALEKAIASRNPVGIEPGRYTVILEPQAVHELMKWVVTHLNAGFAGLIGPGRVSAENVSGPFAAGFDNALGIGRSKLGLKVVDERITISHDPMDPALGVVPWVANNYDSYAEPVLPVTWIDHGILKTLAYDRGYAVYRLGDNVGAVSRDGYRMSGGTTTVDEMIRTTERGLLVTRFWNTDLLDPGSVLLTGLTRDGLWLIEHGKISKAVKNFRFTESPLFVLNSLDQLGEPVPVFSPDAPAIVPPLKAHDFSFTSLVDAV
jgi:predicted Zn-dependent protease